MVYADAGLKGAAWSRRALMRAGAGVALSGAVMGGLAAWERPAAHQAARTTGRAARSMLTRVVRAGSRLVAVGERGIVVLSDDGGQSWRQVPVPVDVTLTDATFVNAKTGWLAGHSGVLLHTRDAGESWSLQADGVSLATAELQQSEALPASMGEARDRRIALARRNVREGADKPFLSLCFVDDQRGLAVGAYGMAAMTTDGGRNWQPCAHRFNNPRGMHLYSAAAREDAWLVAGEQGLLNRSLNGGESFSTVESPVQSTFFTVAAAASGDFVVAGLLGNACRVNVVSGVVRPLDLPGPYTVLSATRLSDERLLLIDSAGRLLVGGPFSSMLIEQPMSRRGPLTSVAEAADGGLVATGAGGAVRLPIDLRSLAHPFV